MKLWLISRRGMTHYDNHYSFVVRASNAEEARSLAAKEVRQTHCPDVWMVWEDYHAASASEVVGTFVSKAEAESYIAAQENPARYRIEQPREESEWIAREVAVWLNPEHSNCSEVLLEGKAEVILGSFRNG